MTIAEEGRAIQSVVSKLRPDKRRRYGSALVERILAWVERATVSGMTEAECGHAIGVKTWRFKMWRDSEVDSEIDESPTMDAPDALALVPIDVTETAGGHPIVITPSGYRVEGLAISEIAALLRALA